MSAPSTYAVEVGREALFIDEECRTLAAIDLSRRAAASGWRRHLGQLWRRFRRRLRLGRPMHPVTAAQVARVDVDNERFLVVLPVPDADRAALHPSVHRLAKRERRQLLLVEQDGPGHASIRLSGTGDTSRAASAVAAIKFSWGWDEAVLFRIQVGLQPFDVGVTFDGARLIARVTLVSPAGCQI